MSDLFGNPEDRFSRVAAHFMVMRQSCTCEVSRANNSVTAIKNKTKKKKKKKKKTQASFPVWLSSLETGIFNLQDFNRFH